MRRVRKEDNGIQIGIERIWPQGRVSIACSLSLSVNSRPEVLRNYLRSSISSCLSICLSVTCVTLSKNGHMSGGDMRSARTENVEKGGGGGV